MTTGERIQQARKKAGLSQKQLGEKLGVSASMIGQWENDLRKPKIETLNRISASLEIESIYLIPDEKQTEYLREYARYIRECRDNNVTPVFGYHKPTVEETQRSHLLFAYDNLLNSVGQRKVLEYAQDIAKIADYRTYRIQRPTLDSTESTDTTPPPDGSEGK